MNPIKTQGYAQAVGFNPGTAPNTAAQQKAQDDEFIRQFKESKEILLTISKEDIFYIESRLILAESANENSFEIEAINILNNLIETQNNTFEIYELLGNIYRYNEKF